MTWDEMDLHEGSMDQQSGLGNECNPLHSLQ